MVGERRSTTIPTRIRLSDRRCRPVSTALVRRRGPAACNTRTWRKCSRACAAGLVDFGRAVEVLNGSRRIPLTCPIGTGTAGE